MAVSEAIIPARRRATLLDRPVLGTDLTVSGGIIAITAAPILWVVIIFVWAALPA